VGVVNLGYRSGVIPKAMQGFGYLVPSGEVREAHVR
jgi:hypothetical protein